MKECLNKWKWNVLSIGLFLLIWEIAALSLHNEYLFPAVSSVGMSLLSISGSSVLYEHLFTTLLRSVECLCLSFIVALPLSYLISRSAILGKLLSPFLYFMKNTPIIAFLLLALIWISSEYVPLFIAFIGMFPILVINFVSGFKSIERKYIEVANLYRLSVLRRFLYIEYPAIKSFLFTGLSSALGLGWRAIIIGEALASVQRGIGAAMKEAQNYVDVSYLFSITIISLLISYFLEKIVQKFAKINPHQIFKHIHQPELLRNTEMTCALKISDLFFQRGGVILFDSFSLQLDWGEVLLLKGKSGIGKSTLINMIGGFEKQYSGVICSGEKSILFQDQRLCPWLNVAENIDLILPLQVTAEERNSMFRVMEIEHLMERMPDQISGGEAQRVGLCRTLLYPADLYILDEPLTGIGEVQKQFLLQWIRDYVKAKQLSVLWISHDEDQADIADRILEI